MTEFRVVQNTRPTQFQESVQAYLDRGFVVMWIGATKGDKLTTHVAYMMKEKA